MFDFNEEKRAAVAHLVSMASIPGAKAQAWFSANDFARRFPQEFGDLPMLLSNAMAERAEDVKR